MEFRYLKKPIMYVWYKMPYTIFCLLTNISQSGLIKRYYFHEVDKITYFWKFLQDIEVVAIHNYNFTNISPKIIKNFIVGIK